MMTFSQAYVSLVSTTMLATAVIPSSCFHITGCENFVTALDFDSFDMRMPALSKGFDLVAHSMGGIIAKIWLLEHDGITKLGRGDNRHAKVIYMGTRFQGSQNALATLSDGWGSFATFLAGGLDDVRRIVLSFPSIYELFPTYEGCCRLGSPGKYEKIGILDPAIWNAHDWLPPEYRKGAGRAAAFEDGLKSARRVGELMRRNVPGVEQVVFAGDVIETKLYLYVSAKDPSWRKWDFRASSGDGTVPVWSAVNNFHTLAGTQPSFVEHATIFMDEWVKNKLARELVHQPPPPVKGVVLGQIATSGGTKQLKLVRIKFEPAVAAPGSHVRLLLILEFADPVSRGDVRLTMRGPANAQEVSINEITTDDDVAARRLDFSGPVIAPHEEGTFRIDVAIPGQGTLATYLTVLASSGGQ